MPSQALCAMDNCEKPIKARGYCTTHYKRLQRHGDPAISKMGPRYIHGQAKARTPTYRTWVAMRVRCMNPNSRNYKWYGAKGVTVCERWTSFANFLADMGERPAGKSIDRINNELGYEPGNCRWATPKEQIANRRPFKRRARVAT